MSYQTTLVDIVAQSKDFQLLMNNTVEVFEQPIWSNYMTDQFQMSLDWRAVLAVMENAPMASVIDYSSGKPLKTRPTVSKLSGEIPTFGDKWQMSRRQVREFQELQDNVGKLGINPTQLIDFLIPDLKRATLGPHATIDRLLLEAMSTGAMTLTATNNPKGVIWNSSLDWGIDKSYVAVVWSTANALTMTPITDIKAVMNASDANYQLIKMSQATFNLMVNSKEFKDMFTRDFGVNGGTVKGTTSANAFFGVNVVNEYFATMDLPQVEIINKKVFIEKKDGTRTTVKPFADNRVTFSVDNEFGSVIRTYAHEQRNPNPVKTYATAMNVLIAKYMDMDGNEFTESELNAFPVLNKASEMNILITDATA